MRITNRERQVVERVMDGKKRDVIACELGICPRTVHFHLSNVRRKLAVQTVLELAIFFARHPVDSDSFRF